MFHDSHSDNSFEIFWRNGTQNIDKSNVNFPKKISFWSNMGPIWPKITQLVLTAQIFRTILG